MLKRYIYGAILAMIIPLTLTSVLVASINAELTEETVVVEEFVAEETEAVKTAKFVRREAITGKENKDEEKVQDIGIVVLPLAEVETEAVCEPTPLYRCDGELMDEDLQRFLYETLTDNGIAWFFPYAIAQATQESECDPHNVTGIDCGLFQYRKTHWNEKAERYGYFDADIFNAYIQIDIYVHEMSKRINEYGCSLYEAISRHYTSDYGTFNQKYVNDVMERYQKLERLR